MTHPAFIADALDDLAEVGDPWAPEPKPAPVAPFLNPAVVAASRHMRATHALMNCDADFLALVDPAAYLLRGSYVAAFQRGAAQTGAYQAVPGAGKALRKTLRETGVL